MTNAVKRFVNEAILRKELSIYAGFYRLSNGKYYKMVIDAYDCKGAERKVMKNLSDASYYEYEPSDLIKKTIEIYEGLYVHYMGKAE